MPVDRELDPTDAWQYMTEKALPPKAETICQEADRIVSEDRQGAYSHPLDDFSRTAAMLTGLLRDKLIPGMTIEPEEVALIQICVKLSREMYKHRRDSLVDIAGYAKTVDLVHMEREARRGE